MPIVLVLFALVKQTQQQLKYPDCRHTNPKPEFVDRVQARALATGSIARPLARLDQGQESGRPAAARVDRGVKLFLENAPNGLLAGSAWFRWMRGGPDHLAGLGGRRAIGTFCPRMGTGEPASIHPRKAPL